MSTPMVGRSGVVKKDGVAIAYCKGITTTVKAEIIKDYSMDSNAPVLVEGGPQTYQISIERMYIDNTYLSLILAGTKVDIEVGPAGSVSTKPKITLSDVVFSSWKISQKMTGAVLEDLEGEGISAAAETYA